MSESELGDRKRRERRFRPICLEKPQADTFVSPPVNTEKAIDLRVRTSRYRSSFHSDLHISYRKAFSWHSVLEFCSKDCSFWLFFDAPRRSCVVVMFGHENSHCIEQMLHGCRFLRNMIRTKPHLLQMSQVSQKRQTRGTVRIHIWVKWVVSSFGSWQRLTPMIMLLLFTASLDLEKLLYNPQLTFLSYYEGSGSPSVSYEIRGGRKKENRTRDRQTERIRRGGGDSWVVFSKRSLCVGEREPLHLLLFLTLHVGSLIHNKCVRFLLSRCCDTLSCFFVLSSS